MAQSHEVLTMLCSDVEYALIGDKYEDINWFGNEPAISKKQFEDGFSKFDTWKSKQDNLKATQRQAILDRIGLTADELKTILG